MLDVISLFNEKDTRDEMGIGSIRDAFADQLFPGTSTIQTRARYFLFIPWIYQELERHKTPSNLMDTRLRQREVQLIYTLIDARETGVIGAQARERLKRLPSNIYWYGLGAWGIRYFPGSQDEYHRSLDTFYPSSRKQRNDDGEPVDGRLTCNWHPSLPAAPANFPGVANFTLTRSEAEYLAERIITRHPNSLLAFLVNKRESTAVVRFAWEHPLWEQFPSHLQKQLSHARNFSETLQGAALLYNLMLAEEKNAQDWIEDYREALQGWAGQLNTRRQSFKQWDLPEFWTTVTAGGAQVSLSTRDFIRRWLTFALNPEIAPAIASHLEARHHIRERELFLKKGQARLSNARALELWQGESGTAQLDYRWGSAQRILLDILNGFTEEEVDAAA